MQSISYRPLSVLAMLAVAGTSQFAAAQTRSETIASSARNEAAAPTSPGEIVVTAQRRNELARDVPIALTALSSEQLANTAITDTRELVTLTPGLQMDRIGGYTLPAIRGITSTTVGPALDNNVAIYLDGVYQPSVSGGTFDLPDVERIEILKGPQGTLFGRNATGGAIQVFTRQPSYTPEGAVTVRYGNYDDLLLNGFVSAPIVADKIAFSLAAFYHRNDSYYNNIRPGGSLQGEKSLLIRGKLRFNPTENLEILLTGAYGNRRESLAIYGSTLNGNTSARLIDPDSIIPTKPYDVALNDEVKPQRLKSYDLSSTIKLTLDGGVLSSITSYLKRTVSSVIDSDYAYEPNGFGVNYYPNPFDEYFSQEINYSSDLSGSLNFSVGTYFTSGKGGLGPLGVEAPTYGVAIFSEQKVKSLAGFGEIYWDVTDRLRLIGGLRYSWEKRSLDGTMLFGLNAAKPDTLPRVGSKSWNSLTPRISLRYELTPQTNIYATYSQGFKSGVFNTNNVLSVDYANPEKVKAYEVGIKGKLGQAVSFEASAFYYDYKDLQVNISTLVDGIPLSYMRNAASARIYGLDADATIRFSPFFNLRAAGTLLDAKYDSFASASVNRPCTSISLDGSPCSTVGVPLNVGNATVPFDASGGRMIRAPKFSASVTANAHIPVGDDEVTLSSTLYYTSRYHFTLDRRVSQSAYAALSARAAWHNKATGLTFAVYGRNLTDKATIAGTFISDISDGISWSPPRTYGVELGWNF